MHKKNMQKQRKYIFMLWIYFKYSLQFTSLFVVKLQNNHGFSTVTSKTVVHF